MPSIPQQIDLLLSEISTAPLKDDRVLMEYPFFSIQKSPRRTPIIFIDGDTEIRVEPGPKGIATVWDKDILIYLATIINDQIEKKLPVSRTITFPAYDCLKITGRGTGKRSYDLFINALYRLRSTNIVTNIQSGNQRERSGFGWIESWRVLEEKKPNGRMMMKAVEVTINDWMFRALVKDRRVLSINEDYFALTGGLERRLYELARKHCGRQRCWTININKLAEKCGTTRDRRKFKADLIDIEKSCSLPDYTLRLEKGGDQGRKVRVCNVCFFSNHPVEKTRQLQMLEITDEVFAEAQRLYPGYDIQFIKNTWQAWVERKRGNHPRNPDAAFLAFCKKFTASNPLPNCG